jgi:predicted adenine nucleotide alpha hydrolase (AANH) superfamily ATPase
MILLHCCCANCVLNFIDNLSKESDLTLYYYNPNIHPRSEYLARLEAIKKVNKLLGKKLVFEDYRPYEYFQAQKNLRNIDLLIADKRCVNCWTLRLKKVFSYAVETGGYSTVSTTLLQSKYQNQKQLIEIGKSLANIYSLNFFVPNSVKCRTIRKGFYKQNYCGCTYSLKEKLENKYRKATF